MKACEAQLFELREMEEMVEFMKNEVPNWEPSLLQVPGGSVQRLAPFSNTRAMHPIEQPVADAGRSRPAVCNPCAAPAYRTS